MPHRPAREWIRWSAFGVLTVAFAALTVSLGNWQARRAESKEMRQRQLDERKSAPPIDLARDRLPEDMIGRRVRVSGAALDRLTLLLDNRVHAKQAGYHVYTPVRIDDATVVMVNRGWVPQGDRTRRPGIATLGAVSTIEGVAEHWPGEVYELGHSQPEAPAGQLPVWPNLTPERFSRATGVSALAFIVQQTAGADDELVRDWAPPGAGSATNRMYSLQWYSFAALAVVLYLVFAVRALRSR